MSINRTARPVCRESITSVVLPKVAEDIYYLTVQSSELIYYVDAQDNPTGEVEEKLARSSRNTKLHAAFFFAIFLTIRDSFLLQTS